MRIVLLLVAIQLSGTTAWFFGESAIQPHEDVKAECLNPPADNPCLLYECLNRRFPCGSDGYALNVGLHFCSKKNQNLHTFTPEGRVWLNETNYCIRNALKPVYETYQMRCSDIRNAGAAAMVDCVDHTSQSGLDFCSFVQSNAEQYAALITLDDVSRLISLRNPTVAVRLIVDGANCGGQILQDRLGDVAGGFNDMVGSLLSSFQGLSTRWNRLWD